MEQQTAVINTLVVVDDNVSLDRERGFSLVHFLGVLRQSTVPRFAVDTRVRRKSTPLFTDELLRNVHVLWLFGTRMEQRRSPDGYELTVAELKAITAFMNRGGGVFATGDHEDIGASLCGRIPRVRSMRKWYWVQPLPPLQPRAPIGTFEGRPDPALKDRHDTLVRGTSSTFYFEDESDVAPQRIAVKHYAAAGIDAPHPVLMGPHGTIDVLPDHAHEGECLVPDRIDERQYDFGGLKGDEYPRSSGGPRVLPEVIAAATILEHATVYICRPASYKPQIDRPRSFGVIGAYDGQRAGVGRVLVDATWHHFFDINLTGRSTPEMAWDLQCRPDNDPRRAGFRHTTADWRVLRQIDAYFVNIGFWLAPKRVRLEAAAALLDALRHEYPLIEELPPVVEAIDAEGAAVIGGLVRSLLGGAHLLVLQTLLDEAGQTGLNPWSAGAEQADAVPRSPFLRYERALDAVLGGAILGLAQPRAAEEDPAAGALSGIEAVLRQLPGAITSAAGAFAAPLAR